MIILLVQAVQRLLAPTSLAAGPAVSVKDTLAEIAGGGHFSPQARPRRHGDGPLMDVLGS